MDNTWVKLYRKLANHEILHDSNALKVFIWLLTRVDKKTGKITIGRFRISEELRMNPSTLRDTIYRLRDKYKIADTKSDNKKTEIRLLKWAIYNPHEEKTTGVTTTRRQPDDTYTRHIDIKTDTSELQVNVKNVRIFLRDFLSYWNLVLNTKYQTTTHLEENALYWLEQYTGDQIYQAIKNIPLHGYWKDKMTPTVFFRKMNTARERVDYIGELLNVKEKSGFSEDYKVYKV